MNAIFTHATALGLCLFVTLPAVAAERASPQAIVRTADLNLASSAGQQALRRRISAAANHVCGHADDRDLPAHVYIKKCRATALASARPQMETILASVRGGNTYSMANVMVTPGKLGPAVFP